MALALQQELFEPSSYHQSADWGYFSILTRQPGERALQSSHLLRDMPQVVALLDPQRDTWISQAEFAKQNRRVVNVLRIGLLFCDLDSYKLPGFERASPQTLLNSLLFFCAVEGIPAPSIVLYSGRGLQAKWLLDKPIPRQALPRWNACQRYLVEKLKVIGADPAARDASRVLRLVDTVNTKSGEMCHVLHVTEQAGEPVRYGFDYLAEHLLPLSREALAEARDIREKLKEGKGLYVIEGGATAGLKRFSGRTLAWHRLEDLRTLAEIRGGVQEGQRMLMLFWQLNFLLLSGATNSAGMWHEAAELARQIDRSWSYGSSELSTLYNKARLHEKGERVEFNGRELTALYTPKNATLIELFGITDDEQSKLKTIISTDIAKQRDAGRKRKQRQDAGSVDRTIYESNAQQKRATGRLMRAQGASWSAVAEAVGYKDGNSARVACR